MKPRLPFILTLSSGGMMLSWLYAWSSFITACMAGPSIPLLHMFAMLAFSACVTYFHKGRGWRIITILLLHLGAFLLTLSWLLYIQNRPSAYFYDVRWLRELFISVRGLMEWMMIILDCVLAVIIWVYGIRLISKPMDENTISARFDLGLSFFTLLLLIKLTILLKGGEVAGLHSVEYGFLYFFLFGLFALGLVHYQGNGRNGTVTYYKSAGIIISFTLFVFILGGLLSTVFLPGLTAGAEISYDLLKTASKPFFHVFIFILRILFMKGCRKPKLAQDMNDSRGEESVLPFISGEDHGLLMVVLGWIMAGMGIVLALLVIWLLLYYLYRLLGWRTGTEKKTYGAWNSLHDLITALISSISTALYRLFQKQTGVIDAGRYYDLLLGWGKNSGLPHRISETPKEYGSRLWYHFPSQKKEIEMIISIHNRFVYREMVIGPGLMTATGRAWRKLRSPLIWPIRVKTWFTNPEFINI